MRAFVRDLETQVVLCDDDGTRAALSARTLERMGYTNVQVLEGGLDAWQAAGQVLEWGSNVPSKDFGERVQMEQAVPEVTPRELADRQARGEAIMLLDARTPEEHEVSCIPGSRSMPTVELALRAGSVAEPGATIVVHCAGRTRSIIGAQTLRRMGYRNVSALKNGTMGWVLDGLTPETGSTRVALPLPAEVPADRARTLALEDGVRFIPWSDVAQAPSPALAGGGARPALSGNVYLIDVRTREEYLGGHIPGFQWVPGGQAIQRADEIIGVRAGHIVFTCDGVVRAAITGSWFRQMGFPNVSVLEGGTAGWQGPLERGVPHEEPFGYQEAAPVAPQLSPEAAAEAVKGNPRPLVLFVDTSREYAAGHLAGSFWLPRGWLELRVAEVARDHHDPVLVTSADGANAVLAAATLVELGYRDVSVLEGGIRAWRAAGLPLEEGFQNLLASTNDFVRAGTERSREEMVHYLEWEEALGEKYRRI